MKKEIVMIIFVVAVFTAMLYFCLVTLAHADVDLTQCTVNNQLEVCNQSLEKSLDVVEVETVIETKKEITLNEFIYQLVEIVKERKAEQDVVIVSYFEDDSSILIEEGNEIKCVNGVCDKQRKWR